ncbi:MAG: type IV toxin-antitoxin system AbiEi family antitoxin domain-containing protein [Brooklawnia sp.]|jgi:hypothetical protein
MPNPGPFTRAQLAELGIRTTQLKHLMAAGQLRRVRRGWYANVFSPDDAVRAVQLGGRLGCLSACKWRGIWVPQHNDLHVMLNPGARKPSGGIQQVQFHRLARACTVAVAPALESLGHVLHRHDAETALVVLESAVNLGLLHEAAARQLLSSAPARARGSVQYFSPLAQSGSETRLRLFFQRRGVAVQPQAFIPDVGQVDLLVGKSWIIEADSKAHHSAPRNVSIDCERDFNARALGYTRDRLSYEQIWQSWPRTQQWLSAVLAGRRHLRQPIPLRIATG